ncbi:Zn(II)2Cys6 transcription factor [Aspergillus puulaauensis]|uniref:Zn(2)-C6 fungal-type domain-containing protein n=1 Tax=Aspergillus puulaauensis TaxID=1220207 RepID=A0A7R7XU13_9EURO|nr:uncharacterized protein APUU_51500A [Aspergillus puulaauensis]BCS26789.1 hypothetical protein APUU_51500A [Aspergillus puulaauensis]
MSSKRIPCDQCRARRVRCDGLLPCSPCQHTRLACKREYVRKQRGPKGGSGKKIEELRVAQNEELKDHLCPENVPRLMKRCVDVYLRQMYPVMPLCRPSTLVQWAGRPLELEPNEESMLFALCALVTAFLCGRSESIIGCGEWASASQRLLEKSLSMRSAYNFIEDGTVLTLLASFFVAVTHFELHNARQSWFYLREAITLAQALGLHTDEFYCGLDYVDAFYCRRIYNILFVTERSFAIARQKPVFLQGPLELLPVPESDAGLEEQPEIDLEFRQLVRVYSEIGIDFFHFWSRTGSNSSKSWKLRGSDLRLNSDYCVAMSETQKADILVTQHWLDLILWRAALEQGLLSTGAESRSRTFSYPEDIALSLLKTLTALPQESVEVHGLGIFEKINDVGNTLADFIQCSTNLTGWTATTAQNLDRLGSIQKHLSLSPNSHTLFAGSLGRRLAECYHNKASMLDMLLIADEDAETDEQETNDFHV